MSEKHLRPVDDRSIALLHTWRDETSIGQWLGFDASLDDQGHLYQLHFHERHIGNDVLRAIHGGVISSFLEACAINEIRSRLPDGLIAKAISIHCNYLRPAAAQDMFARVSIIRHGRRVSFLEVSGWQASPDEPIARAAVALRIKPAG